MARTQVKPDMQMVMAVGYWYDMERV